MADIGQLLAQYRQASGLTQEGAAEAVNIHPRTLQRYEAGDTVCPDDMIWQFSRAYRDDSLCFMALQQGALYRAILPEFKPSSKSTAALNLIAQLNQLEGLANDLILILADGEIDEGETDKWNAIMDVVRRTTVAGLQILEAGGDRR